MPVRFAAARHAMRSPIARTLGQRALARAANDNGGCDAVSETILHATLRHFGTHGLGAAQAAHDEAVNALANGDRQGFDWWNEICRTLDRRLADRLDAALSAVR